MAVSAFLFLLVMVEPPVKKEFYLFVKVVSYYYTNPPRTVKRMRAETSFFCIREPNMENVPAKQTQI